MTATRSPRHRHERGFALLIVLWTLVLLALLVTHVAATGRREAEIATNVRVNAQTQAIVDGAAFEAGFRVLANESGEWQADGVTHEITRPGGRVIVAVHDPANLVNLNTATPALLRALLLGLGADDANARALASAIADWRERGQGSAATAATAAKRQRYRSAGLDYAPPEAPFHSVDELRLVVGMTPELLARLEPHLTVWSAYGPVATSPDLVIRAAMEQVREEGGDLPDDENYEDARVLVITAESEWAHLQRLAVLRFDLNDRNRPCGILAWQDAWRPH